ncbi:uncharacterized protein LY89DRAFT_679489 [Mollisia scopiformis]|uniref:U6 snRNA phosphodiesterase n=1 Tax=Mollisia scopiformis TaxID=149040 RepID=A0A194XX25_MOLSC|nr:uncharacterized protein LY89DRAFT_679489 [Mollisia scopiformis]KUJ24332.1 hypothetical protein LY89DRAFT_679489 [Mollisia scopiformis]
MALVDYASSDEEDEIVESTSTSNANAAQSLKRKREESASDLPPLPSKFHDLYASTTRVSTRDDPSLHGGRKRVMPHVEGNWPTHLYIEWYPSTTEYSSLDALVSLLKDTWPPEATDLKVNSFLTSDLGAPLPLHISLSRSLGFSTEQKDEFVSAMERAIQSSTVRPFVVSFADLDWVSNFENTRWFLVLKVLKPDLNALNKLLHISNSVVQEHGQPPLYSKPATTKSDVKARNHSGKRRSINHNSALLYKDMQDLSSAFHISIAWTLTDPSQELLDLTKSAKLNHFDPVKQIQVVVEDIKVKIGNVVTSLPLPKSVNLGKSLFGA